MNLLVWLACAHPLAPVANADESVFPAWKAVDEVVLKEMQRRDLVAVSACAARDGVLLWCQGYGWADVDAQIQAIPDTPFLLASMSKPVTTAGVLLAQEQGLLALEDPVSVSLPQPWDQAPSYVHLLTHTASFQDDLDTLLAETGPDVSPDLSGWLRSELSREDLLGDAVPGSSWAYSNTGIALAALGVEEAAGQGFFEFLTQSLLTPMDLGFQLEPELLPISPAHRYLERDYQVQADVLSSLWPAGFLYGTAGDYARFLGAISGGLDGGFDGQPMLASATEADDFGFLPYEIQGLGCQRFLDIDGREVWGHEGGYYGANTLGLVDPETGLSVVVLTTGGPPAGYRAWRSLTDISGAIFAAAEAAP